MHLSIATEKMVVLLCWFFAILSAQHAAAFVLGPSSTSTRTPAETTRIQRPVVVPPVVLSVDGPSSRISSSTQLFENKLWDRLAIEEDEEPFWYLINCVATKELDLLRQCQAVTADMEDAHKFVVPLESKTRSHGAKKMVTEEKVKYPGYVFAKLRLCPQVYEAIQPLDLCRSWVGNVNHKGYKKRPPKPIGLNELEVENFGLEEMEELVDDDGTAEDEDAEGIIVDSEEEYYDEDPMYKGIDREALKKFKGLKVGDLVKVTKQGKFFNEDGIVRRLKDGKIFVRFYTYGTLFEEWLDPDDMRVLSANEVQRGLGGPSQPITQRDLDGPSSSSSSRYGGGGGDREWDRPMDLRQSLTASSRRGSFGSGPQQRNRRQDRTANRYGSNNRNDNTWGDQEREERNWNWYKEQQKQKQGRDVADEDWNMRPGSSSSR